MLSFVCLALATTPQTITMKVDGVEREALVYEGQGPIPAGGRPLIFAWHGHGGGMKQASFSYDIHDAWPEATVVYPQGLPTKGKTDAAGVKRGWQQNVGQENDRDIHFFDALLTYVMVNSKIDKSRIYSMGHSNGARFSYVLWQSRGNVFAGYGISGSPAIGMVREFNPNNVMVIAGETDPIVNYKGQVISLQLIARLDGVTLPNLKPDGTVHTYSGKGGLEIVTLLHPTGHIIPQGAIPAMVSMFKRHHK